MILLPVANLQQVCPLNLLLFEKLRCSASLFYLSHFYDSPLRAALDISSSTMQANLDDQPSLVEAGRNAIARTFREEGICEDLWRSHVIHESVVTPEEWKHRLDEVRLCDA